jgi:hypothetical protein
VDAWKIRVTVPGRGHQMPHTYALTEIDPLIEMPVSPYAARHGHFSPFPSAGGAPPSSGGGSGLPPLPRSGAGAGASASSLGGGGGGGGVPPGGAASYANSEAGLSQGGAPPSAASGPAWGGGADVESTHATLGSALGSGPSSGSLGSAPDPSRPLAAAAAAAAAAAGGAGARGSAGGGRSGGGRDTSGGGCVSVADTDDAYAALAYQGSFFNYFSIGGDAQAAHGFHSLRERRPGCAGTRFANMFWYSWFSCSSGETTGGDAAPARACKEGAAGRRAAPEGRGRAWLCAHTPLPPLPPGGGPPRLP